MTIMTQATRWATNAPVRLSAEQEFELLDVLTDPNLTGAQRFAAQAEIRFGLSARPSKTTARH